jgi:triacylglycerol lipase
VRAVVIVSGGDAVTPFTTPTAACATGLAAGNTATALRAALRDAGMPVFTAPAMNEPGPVREPDPGSFGAFGGCPPQLPAELTVTSTAGIDTAGAELARFAGFLREQHGVTGIDWIGHSNGGLFARAATRILRAERHPVAVRSLTTLGTPWTGANPLRIIHGEVPESECRGQASCLAIVAAMREAMGRERGLAAQNTRAYLAAWDAAQAGVLDGIPVLLVGGTHLRAEGGDPEFWPNDGLVSEHSALATGVRADVLPAATRLSTPTLHSIYVAELLGEAWETGMTWNAEVAGAVRDFLADLRR